MVNVRVVAALAGLAAIAVAMVALGLHIETSYFEVQFGVSTVDCGNSINPADYLSGAPASACLEAVSDRRGWALPVGVGGFALVLGAALIKPRKSVTAPEREPENH